MNEEFDDEVVIEGSDLHKALTDVGFTDFECTYVDRKDFYETEELIDTMKSSEIKNSWFKNFFTRLKPNIWNRQPLKNSHGVEELEIILQLLPLLDDHSLNIQNILKERSPCSKKYSLSSSIIFSSAIATSTLVYKQLRFPVIVTCSAISGALLYYQYCNKSRINDLKNLVSIQNNIYWHNKKIFRILKNDFNIKSSPNKSKKINDLEVPRLKYLQPMCEIFIKSIKTIAYSYYKISLLIIELLSESLDTSNLLTNFNNDAFKINGEITYESLKQFYYIYILIQSDMMHLISLLYKNNLNNHKYLSNKIIKFLLQLLKPYDVKLNKIIEEYKGCGNKKVHYKLKKRTGTKWQDLYINIDLLSRKIQSAYSNVSSIIDDIDDCPDFEESDEFLKHLMEKMNDVYKEIDTARNFAEFNRLLIGKFLNSQAAKPPEDEEAQYLVPRNKELPVVFDEDPQIIDEVFEEYIKEEYLKPLYQDNDVDSLERAKLDKLLAKNFMSELKEVLIDRYQSMSKREARALMKYRKNLKDITDDAVADEDEEEEKEKEENSLGGNKVQQTFNYSSPPPAPPLPVINNNLEIKRLNRPPVPLPRSIKSTSVDNNENNDQKILNSNLESIVNVASERISINMNRGFKFPDFISAEETFVGSGENSDEELVDDNDDENDNQVLN
ncbi:uncharacterized protein LOC103576594 [Microplitis demolitor]|uniref:uncharacterized protein LOC103576594 n=1 Tax=Microplitis demolitor TaxID=69319 RepID=UPI0004CCFCA8|nr:uncharacterized protein LOC103576594 [Microplitis demolitor]